MPHQCTTCDRTFPDGSKAMLGGCPDCGGNKFQFLPSGALDGAAGGGSADAPAATDPSASPGGTTGRDPSRPSGSDPSSSTARDPRPPAADERSVARSEEDILEAPSEPRTGGESSSEPTDAPEDVAQASARRSFVSREELPSVDDRDAVLEEVARDSRPGASDAGRDQPDRDERPDLETLRRELNDQFESIKIVEPGEYELNLMELYDREEYIIALKEDGRYVIDVPARWTGDSGD